MEGSVGLQADALNPRIQLFQPPGSAYKCAARTKAGHKMGHAVFGLLPNFGCGGLIMRAPVGWIAVLIGIKIFLGIAGVDLTRAANGSVGTGIGWRQDNLRTVGR